MRNDVAASSPSAAPVESPRVRTRLRPATGTTTRIASTSGTSAGTVAKVLAVGIVALVALVAYLAYASRGESALVDPRAGVATTPPRDALAAVADVSRDGDAAAPVDPVVTQRGDRERATEFEDQSNRALEHKEFARALELAESALELRPTTSAYVLKARALERLRRFDAALDVLDQAEQTTSNKLQILGMRGRILWESGQKKSARTIMETYLEHAPSGKMAPQFHEWLDKAP